MCVVSHQAFNRTSIKSRRLLWKRYIGKICPLCKTEIKEGDAVIVCPECGIPHHEACWKENKGCTTFGCSQQHYEEQRTQPIDFCMKCGAPLGDGQDFCPKCGTPKGGEKKRICSRCGAELLEGHLFCSVINFHNIPLPLHRRVLQCCTPVSSHLPWSSSESQ